MKELQLYIVEKFKIKKGVKAKEYTPTRDEKLDEIALQIVSSYFGGYIPKTLKEEGFDFNNDKEKYSLADKMERYFVNETDFECSDNDADIIHNKLIDWLEKHNR